MASQTPQEAPESTKEDEGPPVSPSGYHPTVMPGWKRPRFTGEPFVVAVEAFSLQVPSVTDETVAAGTTRTVKTSTDMLLCVLLVDVPPDVDALLTLDGNPVHNVSDQLGSQGGIPFGDYGTGKGRRVQNVVLTVTNNGSSDVNVRYVLCGLPAAV